MKRCCDYDAIVHYQAGTFASRFADDMEGKLLPVERDRLEPWEAESFLNGKYDTYITREPIVMYRLYGKYQKEEEAPVGARLGGRFVSTEFAESAIDAKLRLALQPGWKNTKMYEAKLIVPAGTRVNVGIVAPVTTPTGNVLPGGAPQIMLPEGWPEEIIEGKEKLYPDICPRCCYPKVRKLDLNEYITITGSKGRRYTLKKECLNAECQYHW